MEKISHKIKRKVDKLNHSYTKKELGGIEQHIADFEKDEIEISDYLKKVNYLLDLIDKHEVKALDKEQEESEQHNNWLSELQNKIEKLHLKNTKELSPADIEFLETEKIKLNAEKKRLGRDQKYILSLIAKSKVYLMETRETACIEITKGQGINELSEKLVDHFGRKLDESIYEFGRNEIMKFIEKTFSLGRIDAHKAFSILEKSGVVKFEIDTSSLSEYIAYDNFYGTDYTPVVGTWCINA